MREYSDAFAFPKKEQFPSQVGVASSTQVHPPSQGKDMRKGTLSKVWCWRGDLSKRYFWIVKQPLWGSGGLSCSLWVEEEGKDDKGNQEPPMNLHTLVRSSPWSRMGIRKRKPWALANEHIGDWKQRYKIEGKFMLKAVSLWKLQHLGEPPCVPLIRKPYPSHVAGMSHCRSYG